MNIINDTSSQTVITALPTITGSYDPYVTSNELYTGFYTKTQTNTLLNAKENVLTFNAPLTRNTNTIGIDLSSYLTTSAASSTYQPILSFSSPMNKTGNNVTIDLSSYATTASLAPYITSNSASNIFLTIANASATYATISSLTNYMTSNATSNIFLTIANASATYATISSLTNYMTSNATSNIFLTQASAAATYATTASLNNYMTSNATSNIFLTQQSAGTTYATITALNTKENILTFNSPLTRSTNAIGIDLSAYSTTSVNNSTYLRLDGSASMTSKLLLLTGGNGNPSFATNNGGTGDRIVFQSGIAGSVLPYSIGYSLNNLWISAPSGASINTYIDGSIMWSVGSTGALLYGNLNASNILEGNQNLSSKYALSSSLANYVLKAGDTMSGALTVNNNINITGSGTNKLIFDNAFNNKKIQINSNCGLGGGNTDFLFYSAGTFTFKDTTLSTTLFSIDNSGSLSFNGRLYPGKGLYTDNVVTSTSNIISSNFIEGGVSLSSKYLTSASLATTYLKLDGTNDMTGKLTVLNGAGLNTPQIADYGGTGDRLILWKGGGNYPYSLGINSGTMWYSVPTGAIHNFYVNGTSRYQINTTGASVTGALTVSGNTTTATLNVTGITTIATNNWITSSDTILRIYFANNDATLFQSPNGYNFRKTDGNSLLLINNNGTAGIGTNTSVASLSLYSTTQVQARLILSGQEFYIPFDGGLQNSSAQGVAFLSGVNRAGNRQLWIGDSANLTQNSTNSVLRLTNLGYIDCIATDGLTRKQLTICNLYLGANGVNIGMNTTSYKSTTTVLTIAGGTNGYSQPLVQITQNNGWDGNYALQVKGYANIGGDGSGSGLRINGEDTGNTIFQNGNNPIGITVNNSWIAFNTNGGERMRLAANGEIFFVNNVWQRSYDNVYRMYYETNGRTYFSAGGNLGFIFRSTDQLTDVLKVENNGNIRAARSVYCDGNFGYFLNINANNYWNIYTGTTNGVANSLTFFHGATGLASYWYLNGTQNGTMSEISDKRSKNNIEDFTALETIKKLKPKSFDVIDDKDVRFQYGFIAQDIEEIPELKKLVFTQTDYIANVNTYGSCKDNIITANDDLTGKIEIGDELKLVCDNNNKENQEFILDSTPYHNRYKRRYGKVTEIISPTEFKVDCEINEPFLIYGKKVEDAKSLDYNSFIALNTKAIQELYEIIERQQEQINLLLSNRNVIN